MQRMPRHLHENETVRREKHEGNEMQVMQGEEE